MSRILRARRITIAHYSIKSRFCPIEHRSRRAAKDEIDLSVEPNSTRSQQAAKLSSSRLQGD
jgi:hypothetical protein